MKKLFWAISVFLFLSNGIFAATIFEEYSWLTNIVQPNNCSSEKVEVYQTGVFKYLLVTDTDGVAILYNETGQFYCQNASNFDCVALYNLEGPIDSWDCANNLESTCLVTITNNQCRGIGVYDENDNLLTTMNGGPLPNGPQGQTAPIWEDPRPLEVEENRVYIFKENNFVLGRQSVSCANTEIEVTSNYYSGCTDAVGVVKLINTGCRTISLHNTQSEVFRIYEPGDTFYVPTGPYLTLLIADADTLAIISNTSSSGEVDSGGCGEETESTCAITIVNIQCKGIDVYDENDNFLTSMVSGPHPFGSFNQAPSIWEDSRPLGVDETRKYTFKEGNIVIGRQTVSCAKTAIEVVNNYSPGCTDIAGGSTLINTGCQTITVHNSQSMVYGIHAPGDTFYLRHPDVFTLLVGADTLSIFGAGFGTVNMDSGGCEFAENEPISNIPENFKDYHVIYTLCKGDTLSIRNPERVVQCRPAPLVPGGPLAPAFSLFQTPIWSSNSGIDFSEDISAGRSRALHLFPTETTTFEGVYPSYSCEGLASPMEYTLKYLVLVEEQENCTSDGQPNFIIEACIGDIIEIPSPNQAGQSEPTICDEKNTLAGGSVAELVEESGTTMKVRIKEAGRFAVNGIGGGIRSTPNQAMIFNLCPQTMYQFEVKLKTDCGETGENVALFEDYPWLNDLVQPNNCSNEKVEAYQTGNFTYLLVTDTDGIATLYNQDGIYYCQMASDFDCIAFYNLEGPIDVWNCAPSLLTTCAITITNNQCRRIGVYDENDNFLASMVQGPHPFGPPNQASSIWQDPRPLGIDEDRVYIFKENNFVLGRQTASCINTEIEVVSNYFSGCTDALGIAELTNTGCRTIEVHNTRSEVVSSHEPGEDFYLSTGLTIHILIAGSDTLGVNANAHGDYDINSGGCEEEGNKLASTIPENFEDYFVIYTLCKGDTLSIPSPRRLVQCPPPSPIPGGPIVENFPLFQRPNWTGSTGDNFSIINILGNNQLHLFPTATTTYEGVYPSFSCGGPAGPLGYIFKYLVIVEDTENCSSDGQPNFIIEACVGDIIELPSPNQVGQAERTICDEFIELAGDNVAELVESAGTTMKVRIKEAGKFSVNGIGGSVESIYNRATIQNPCPLTSYQFEVRLKAGCSEGGGSIALFDDYSWLSDLISLNGCVAESVELYQTSVFFYLLVKDANGTSTLYNQDGQFYCQNSTNYDCVAAYNLEGPIDSWTCGDTPPLVEECGENTGIFFFRECDDGQLFYFIELEDGTIYDPYFAEGLSFDVIDGQIVKFDFVDANFATPCSIAKKAITITCVDPTEFPTNNGDCSQNTGEIVVTECDDGTDFFFIKSASDGLLYDAYFAEGIDFLKYHGQVVNFDFEPAGFNSPCSIADEAIIVTCIEERTTVENLELPAIFSRFEWLADLVDPFNCEDNELTSVAVYQQGVFNFIFVQTDGIGRLYFQDGTFYCQDSENYDCIMAYSLTEPIDFWSCSGEGLAQFSERTNGKEAFNNLKLFPNPVNTHLTVQLPTTIKENQALKIFDTFGRTVLEKTVGPAGNSLEVDVTNFQNGLYYLVLFGNGKEQVRKFVKQDLK